jgi:hypothetical protein
MKYTLHAKKRLKERYEVDDRGIEIIGALLNDVYRYRLVHENNNSEVREVNYLGNKIQAVVSINRILTVIPPTFVETDYYESINNVTEFYEEMENREERNKHINEKCNKLFSCGFLKSVINLIEMRKRK